jgi:hypothetical protein
MRGNSGRHVDVQIRHNLIALPWDAWRNTGSEQSLFLARDDRNSDRRSFILASAGRSDNGVATLHRP